jgi:hypothetical protein
MSTSMLGGYASPAAPVDREITGQLTAYENRSSGWVRFSIQEQGRQYPVKVDTKKQEIVQMAMALGGQMVVARSASRSRTRSTRITGCRTRTAT